MSIYKAYDIRGKVPGELDENLARRIGWAIGTFLGARQMAVGRDVRRHSPGITDALCAGLAQAGVRVSDLGIVTTPLTNFAVGLKGLDGGVMVTASHNPSEYNGFKICRAGAVPVFDAEIRKIGELAEKAPPGKPLPADARQALDIKGEIVSRVVARAKTGGRRLKVVADLSSGAATSLTPLVLKRLPHDFEILNGEPDGRFPSHPPDPLKEENLEQAREAIRSRKADLGAVFDGDADRVVFIDEKGNTVTGDLATLLIALDLVSASGEKKPAVFYDVRCSRVVREELARAGADPRLCRVG
ncbi:MAG: phosphomannomutase/phosphoglucomutase, partial [Bdellovibrionota bacterium]